MAKFLDDLPSSDPEHATDSSSSSLTSISSLSSLSSSFSDHSDSASSSRSTSSFDDFDFDTLERRLMDLWDARVQALAIYLLTTRVLELSPPVKKLGQLMLYLNDFRHDHLDRFRKKLRVLPPVFDCLVELIEGHYVFQNNSHVPQYPIPVQLAILLVHLGHYSNASSPKYVAQWAGVCVGTVINATNCCLVVFLSLHDKVIMMPPEEEKERVKAYMESMTCPEWHNGFLLVDGTKFVLF
jgi:hypothetical protein